MEKKSKSADIAFLLEKHKSACIITHWSPDGDAIGSALGLYHFLKGKELDVQIVVPNEYPEFLKWLPGNDTIVIAEKEPEKASHILDEAELLFVLDFNAPSRFGPLGEKLPALNAKKIMIDHHQEPDEFADHYWHTVNASSTCELIYTLLEEFQEEKNITKEGATCLYTGIMTDTGSFRFPSTTSKTLSIASDLVALGVDNADVYNRIHDDNTEDRLKLLGYALSEKMVVIKELNATYFVLTSDELKKFNFKKGDTEGLVNYGLSIKGIRFSTFIVERDGIVKMSFRSKGSFDVNKFARQHFNGGGHKNAAGGASDDGVKETEERFLEVITEYKDDLNT